MIKEALLTAKHAVNDEVWQLEFKMIAPPNYKCEVITHSKVEGEAKLRTQQGGALAPAAGGVVTITSDAEYEALPSGTTFIGPDGKTRRKP